MELAASFLVPRSTIEDHPQSMVGRLSISEEYFSVGLDDGSVHVCSLRDGTPKLRVTDTKPQGLLSYIWAHEIIGDQLVVGFMEGAIRVWSITNGALLSDIAAPNREPVEQVRSPEAIRKFFPFYRTSKSIPDYLLAGTVSGAIHSWDVKSSTFCRTFSEGHKSTVFYMRPYDNNSKFVSAAPRRTIAAWDFDSGELLWRSTRASELFSLEIANGGAILGREDGVIEVLSLQDGTLWKKIDAHSRLVSGLIMSKNLLVSSSHDGFAKVWSLSSSDSWFELERSEQLYDKCSTGRLVLGDRLITIGKNGGGENVCALDMRLKMWPVRGEERAHAEEIGMPAQFFWAIQKLPSIDGIVVAARRQGNMTVEIWKKTQDWEP